MFIANMTFIYFMLKQRSNSFSAWTLSIHFIRHSDSDIIKKKQYHNRLYLVTNKLFNDNMQLYRKCKVWGNILFVRMFLSAALCTH